MAELPLPAGLLAQLGHDLGATLGLPAVALFGSPLVAGFPVVADVDRRGGALEHVDTFRVLGEVRDDLHSAGAGADDADPYVAEPLEIVASEVVVPARGVE